MTTTAVVCRPSYADGSAAPSWTMTVAAAGTDGKAVTAWLAASPQIRVAPMKISGSGGGAVEVPLTPNVELIPAGTRWRVNITVDGHRGDPVYLNVPVSAAAVQVSSILSDPPGALPTPALANETAARIAADVATQAEIDTRTTDALGLERLSNLRAVDQAASLARQRVSYEDDAQWSETWPDMAAWSTGARQQVSAGKLYSLASPPYPAGVTRALPGIAAAAKMTAAQRCRVVGSVYTPGSGTGANAVLGVDSGGGGDANAGVLSIAGIGFNNGVPSVFNWGDVVAIPGSVVVAAGIYHVMVEVDETTISMVMTAPGHVWEYRYQLARPAGYIGSAAAYVYDARALTGHYVGPLQVRTGLATCSPRTVEGVADRVLWTTAPPQSPALGGAAQKIRVSVPANYDSRVPAPLCLYFHGAGELAGAPNDTDPTNRVPVFTALHGAGYIVASCDADGDNWGNQLGLDDYVVLYRYCRDHWSLGPVVILAQSMGALAGLLTLAERRIPGIVAFAGIFPACSLAALNLVFPASVNTAYGGGYPGAAVGHDPIAKPGTAFRGVPMRFYASYADVTTVRSTNADPFAALVAPYSPEASVVTTTGVHGDPSNYQPADMLAFFRRSIAGSGG